MKAITLAAALCGTALALVACASTGDNLQRATAMAIGSNIDPDSVRVSDIDRGATSVHWNATTPQGRYKCSADDMVRRPYCVRN
jgi:hypothetical protein